MGPVFNTFPKDALEAMAGISISASVTYYSIHDMSATLKNSGIAATAGILWAFARCRHTQAAEKMTQGLYENRLKAFSPAFPK